MRRIETVYVQQKSTGNPGIAQFVAARSLRSGFTPDVDITLCWLFLEPSTQPHTLQPQHQFKPGQ